MGLPEKVKISGLTFNVTYDIVAADRDNFGETSFMKQTITLDPQLHSDKKEETLIHEIIEVINGVYSLRLEHDKITVLATALHQVLKDNKLTF